MITQFLEGAEPLFLSGSNTGCLLLHGAGGGTTWDLKEFAHTLYSKTGITIWLPALTGFGTRPEDLKDVTFSDWMNDTREGVKKLQKNCNRIFIVGHSMGGILALIIASEQKKIDAVVTWAAPFNVRIRKITLLPIIIRIPILKGLIPKQYHTGVLLDSDWVGYEWIPSSIGLVVLEGMKYLKQSLNKVTCPSFIVQGTMDEGVSQNSAKRIFQAINSKKKEIWYVEGAPHALMTDKRYKKELFERTISFLEAFST
ncbi:MAG: alpha/beta hydrolase [Candidatus Hodarchaeota archaeon]